MTEKEAIDVLQKFMCIYDLFNTDKIAIHLGVEALKKREPKKPNLIHDVSLMHINRGNKPHEWKQIENDYWHYPECNAIVGERVMLCNGKRYHDQRLEMFCNKCGQAIDWSKND